MLFDEELNKNEDFEMLMLPDGREIADLGGYYLLTNTYELTEAQLKQSFKDGFQLCNRTPTVEDKLFNDTVIILKPKRKGEDYFYEQSIFQQKIYNDFSA